MARRIKVANISYEMDALLSNKWNSVVAKNRRKVLKLFFKLVVGFLDEYRTPEYMWNDGKI